jgi:tetratricopeptide (TPR) repeat protein
LGGAAKEPPQIAPQQLGGRNQAPGMSSSRLSGMAQGASGQPSQPQQQLNTPSSRTTGGGASVPRNRPPDASRQALRAQANRSFPVIPVAIAAAVVVIGGIVAFVLIGNSQKGKTGTGGSSTLVSPVAHVTPTPSTAGTPPATQSTPGDWQAAETAGAKSLEDANYQMAFKQLSDAKNKAAGHPLDAEYGQLLALYGQAASRTDHFQEAIDALTQAQSIFGKNGVHDQLPEADCKNCLGLVYTNQMDFKNANAFLTEAKAIRDKVGKPEDKADSEQAMAKLYNRFQSREGSYGTDGAIKYLQDALVTRGGSDPAFFIECNNDMGFSYTSKGQFKQARYYYDAALQKAKEKFGVQHPLYADSLVGLGTLNYLDKKFAFANDQCMQALYIRQDNYGPNTIKVAEIYGCLGAMELAQKHIDRAAGFFKKNLEIKRNLLGEENPDYKHYAAKYAAVLDAAGYHGKL